jgi:hypothetical protein
MLASISVGCGISINILEDLQMFIVATIANCCNRAGIVLQDTEECRSESVCDSDMVNSWYHLCQKLDIPAEMALKDVIGMVSDAIVV